MEEFMAKFEIEGFNKARFKLWLSQFEDSDIVGYSGAFYTCPLANFAKELTGKSGIGIGITGVFCENDKFDLPGWAALFRYYIDRKNIKSYVTKKAALAFLEKTANPSSLNGKANSS